MLRYYYFRLWRLLNPARRLGLPLPLWWALRPRAAHIRAHDIAKHTEQIAFRGYADDAGLGAATPKAAQNANWTQDTDENFRIRFEIEEDAGASPVYTLDPQLQYSRNGGAWTNVTGTSSVVRASASPNVLDNAATGNDLTASGLAYKAGSFDEVDGLGSSLTLSNQHTEEEYCVQIRGVDVADNDTIQLRIADVGTALDLYTATPSITVNLTGGPISGTGSPSLGALAATGAGTVTVGGSGSPSLGAVAASSTGTVGASEIVGQGSPALPSPTASGAGTVEVAGAGSQTLATLSLTASGQVPVAGQGAPVFATPTLAAAGAVFVVGSGAKPLFSLVGAASGSVVVSGGGSPTLATLASSGSGVIGEPPVTGEGSPALPSLAGAGAGAVLVVGQGSSTLAGLGLTSAAIVTVAGQGSPLLAGLAPSSTATVPISGQGFAPLGVFTLAGVGAGPGGRTRAFPSSGRTGYPATSPRTRATPGLGR